MYKIVIGEVSWENESGEWGLEVMQTWVRDHVLKEWTLNYVSSIQ